MDDTASKIHDNRMAVAGACGLVALLLFWLAVGWGFLGSLLAGIVVFALLLLLIGWIGASDAAAPSGAAARPAAPGTTGARGTAAPSSVPATPVRADAQVEAEEAGPAAHSTRVRTYEMRSAPSSPPPAAPPSTASASPPPAGPVAADPAPSSDPTTPEDAPLSQPAPDPASPAIPVAEMPPVETAPDHPGTRPATLDAPRDGAADDLKRIKGVGPKLEQLCNRLGFWHFDQIADWTDDEVAWVDEHLEGFRGRVQRDDWVAQAQVLRDGGATEVSGRVDEGEVD